MNSSVDTIHCYEFDFHGYTISLSHKSYQVRWSGYCSVKIKPFLGVILSTHMFYTILSRTYGFYVASASYMIQKKTCSYLTLHMNRRIQHK